MKKFYQITLSILFVFAGLNSFAQSGIYESYAILSINGGANAYYDMQATTGNPDFQGANLGNFSGSNTLTLKGGENKTYKCSPCDITNGNLWHRVYPTGSPSGSFNQISYFFGANLGTGCGNNDQRWDATGSTTNLLSGLSPGNYTVEVYSTADYQGCGTGTHYSSNSSNNYKATFTYCGPSTGALPAGTYSIPGCFATVNAAATYITTNGVSGAVIFNVAAGHTETAPVNGIQLGAITGTSATNTVKFQKSGSGTNPTITAFTPQTSGAKMDAVIRFVGADYVTFDGFTLQENASNTTTAAGTNNMTEFGVGFFGASASNGSQNNTIQNCTISMGSTYPSATGVFSTSTLSTAVNGTTAQVASAASGLHSNNKFYSNTISNVNYGFIFICPTQTTALQESGIEIGGSSAGTGNTVTYGLATGVAQTANWTSIGAGINGIMLNSPSAVSIQRNTLTSTITSNTATDHTAILIRGTVPSSGTYTRTISNNTITLNNSATSLVSNGIDFGNGRASGTLDASNNTITINKTSGAANSRAITGIIAGYAAAGITIAGNTINLNTSISVGSYTGAITGITVAQAAGTAGIVVNINSSNAIKINQSVSGTGSYGSGAITYINATYTALTGTGITVNVTNNSLNTTSSTIRSTGSLVGINCEATVGLFNIKSNTFNIDRVATSGSVNFTFQTTTPSNVADTVSSNTITLTNLAGTASVNGISQLGGPGSPTAGNKSICNNTFSITGTNTGTVTLLAAGYCQGPNIRGNSFTVSTASPTILGITTPTGYQTVSTAAATISGNSFSFTSAASSGTELTAIKLFTNGSNSNVFNNTISNLSFTAAASSAASIEGIWSNTGSNNIYQNTVSGLSFVGTSGTPFFRGIYVTGGTTHNIYKNKVYNFSATTTGNVLMTGMAISSGTTNNIYNNLISGLTFSNCNNSNGSPLSGIFCGGGTTNNIFNNTIYLTGTTTGSIFYSAGIYTSTTSTTVDVRNNIIVNTCSPVGAGTKAAAFYRSGTALTNLATTCNNNFYYAGTPSAANCIYFDITNTDQTIADYKTRVGTTREAASFTENFNPATYFVSTTGSNAGFLHMAAALSTQIESGGIAVSTPVNIADDYDGQTRPGGGGTTNGGGTAPDVGADEFDGAPVDLTAPAITYTVIPTSSCATTGPSLSATITDGSGVNTTAGTKPRLYYKLSTETNGFAATNTSVSNGWKYVEASNAASPFTFAIDYSLLTAAPVAGNTIQYFVVVQDNASTPNVGINSGTFAATPSSVALTSAAFAIGGTINSYSILSTLPTTINIPADYPTLTVAGGLFAALNAAALGGNTVVNINANITTETGATALNQINYACGGAYTLTIKPNGAARVISGANSTNGLIRLNGADNVTIDGSLSGGTDRSLTITNTGTGSLTTAVAIMSTGSGAGANSNTVKNCLLSTGNSGTSASYGIHVGGTTIAAGGADNDNTTIQNNAISVATVGIYANGLAAVSSNGTDNMAITGNSIVVNTTSTTAFGIQLGNALTSTISNNSIDVQTTANAAPVGIALIAGTSGITLSKNSITRVYTSATGGYGGRGITVASGSSSSNILLTNNVIYGVSSASNESSFGNSSSMGIGIGVNGSTSTLSTTCGGVSLYHNSVHMYGNYSRAAAAITTALYVGSGASALNIKNNIFSNTMNNTSASYLSSSKNYAIYSAAANTAFTSIDNNDYSVSNSTNTAQAVPGYLTSNRTDLSGIQTGFGGNTNSTIAVVNFTSNTDLHLAVATNGSLNNVGATGTGVSDDIDGDVRCPGGGCPGAGTLPDMGADEFSPPADDAGISAIAASYCPGSQSVDVTLKNFGSAPITSVTIDWTVNAAAQTTYNWTGTLASGATTTVTLGSFTFVVATNYTIVATTSLPNGNADAASGNDAFTSATFQTGLSGTYTVGSSGNFSTLTAAVAAANSNGLCGPTVFSLTDATYSTSETFPITINSLVGSSSTNTLTIKPSTGVTSTITGSNATTLLKINGTDYLTIDGSNNGSTSRDLTITNTNTGASSAIIWMATVSASDGTTNNTFKNLNLVGSGTSNTGYGLISGGTTVGSDAQVASTNLLLQNNKVTKLQIGFYVRGAAALDGGLIIEDNILGSASVTADRLFIRGIAVMNQNGAIIRDNTVVGITSTGSGTASGIAIGMAHTNTLVERNVIGDIRNTSSTGYGSNGIWLNSSTAASNVIVANNFIYGVASYGYSSGSGASDNGYGIVANNGGGYKVYHNSVAMNVNQSVNGLPAAFNVTSAVTGTLDVRNNIFSNTQSTGTNRYAIYSSAANTAFSNINYNDYWAGTAPNLGYIGSNRAALSDIVTGFGGNANAVSVVPTFTSATDLHLLVGSNSSLNEAATTGISISADIDGDVRCPGVGCPGAGTNPDIGADEFTPPLDDAGLSSAPNTFCPGSQPVTVTLTNGGLSTLTSVTIIWTMNGIAQIPYSWTGSLASTATAVVTLGNFTFVGSTNYVLVATASNPNGNTDANALNDVYTSATFQTGLSGSYTVGTSGNFTTLTAAVAAANTYGLCGATVFNLTDATYSTSETFPITINQLAGSSATNTLTIKPASSVTATISGSNTTALLILNGADYITVDGSNNGSTSRNLTISNTSTNSSSLIVKINSVVASSTGATNNTFKNIILTGSGRNNTLAAIYQGGVTVPSAADFANNNNTYTNNLITACQIGIIAIGLAAGTETGLTISDNSFGHASTNASRMAYDGVFASNQTGFSITGNSVLGVQVSYAGVIEGILVGGVSTNGIVSKNTISYVNNNNSSGYTAAGITLNSSATNTNITVSNNVIYGVVGYGYGSAVSDNGHGILVAQGTGYKIYHNTISLSTNQTVAASTGIFINSTSFSVTTAPSSLDIRNNIFSNSQTTGSPYAIYSEAGSSDFSNINNNVYYSAGTNFGYLGAAQSTLAGWQTATGQDANSLNVAPVFISTSNLHLNTSSNPTLDGAGSTGTGVTDDIDGDVRCPGGSCPGAASNPDPGADEFEVPTCLSPSALAATNITSGGLDIGWTAPSPAPTVGYEWLIVASGAGSGGTPIATTPAAGSVTGTSVTGITGLSASTTYDIWVRSDCGSSLYGPYVGPISFTTRPVNDECAGAVSVTVNSSNVCTSTTAGTSANASQSLAACTGSGTADDDVWYSFVASGTSHTVTLTPGTMSNANFEVLSGTCGSLTSLACVNNTTGSSVETTGLTSLTIGTTYYIRVYSNGNGSGQGTFTLCVSSPPINDACANAINLPCGTSGLAGSTDGAILETAPNGCASSYGVWYSFVGDGSTASITVGSSFDHEITVSSGTCASLTNVSCVDNAGSGSNETATFATTSGTTYYLYVAHYLAGSTTTGSISLTRSSSLVLTNTGAPATGSIPVGTTDAVISGFQIAPACVSFDHTAVTFTTSGTATTSDVSNFRVYRDANNNGTYQSGTDVLVSSSALSLSASLVFTIAGETSLTGTTRYLLVADIASGATVGRTIIASITPASNVTLTSTPTTTMTGTATGNTQTISAAPPANDLCSNATALPCGTSALAGTTVNTITETAPFGCASNFGVWYTFTGDGTATSISVTPTGFDVEITIGSGSCGSLTQVSCTDVNGTGAAETATFNTINGTTYYVYIAQFSAFSSTTGAFTISRTASMALSNTGAPAAGNIGQGVSDALISGFQLAPACATYDLTGVTFTTTGTATTSDLSNFRVYRDVNSNGTYESGTDILASTAAQALSASLVFTITGQTSVSAVGRYLLIADVAAGATVGNTITASITSVSNITYSTSPSVTATGTATGNTRTISGTPPANDECAGATAFPTIPTNGTCVTLSNQSTANATASGVTPTGSCTSNSGNPDDDVWYSFVAPGSSVIINFTYVSGLTDIYWQAFSSACGSTMTSIACSDVNAGGTLTGLTTGSTYYIRLYTYASSGSSVQNICLQTPPPPPANDECLNATVITCSTSGLAGTTVNTVAETTTPPVCSGSISAYGVWYKFTGTGLTTNFTVTPASGYDIEVIAYSGTCGSLTALNCVDNTGSGSAETASITAANGTDYYIYVAYYATGTSTGTFTLSVNCVSPLTNNDCGSATAFPTIPTDGTCASLTNQSTLGATASGVTPTGACSSTFGNADDDVWFSFIATSTSQLIEFTYVAGASDIYWQVFSSACGSTMTSIACSDANSGGLLSGLTIGQTYYLRMYSYSLGVNTTQDICIKSTLPNDDCSGATSLTYCTAPVTGNIIGTTESTPSSCGTSIYWYDLWYKFVAESSTSRIRVTGSSGFDAVVELHDACGGSVLYCRDNNGSGANETINATGLTVGNTYYVRVYAYDDGYYVYPTTYTFTVAVSRSGYWTGAVSTDWNTTGNWCDNSVPTTTDDVTIPNQTNDPIVGAYTANCANFTILSGATFGFSGGVSSSTLIINGSTPVITTNGNTFSGAGVLQIGAGSAIATITGGATFNNDRVTVSANSNLKLNGSADFNIGRAIRVNSGASVYSFGSNNTGNYPSTPNATAYLHFTDDGVNNGIVDYNAGGANGFISGQVKSDRRIAASNTGYRYISAPLQGTISQWADDFTITGADGFVHTGTAFTSPWPTLWQYDESNTNPNMAYGWVSNTNGSNVLDRATGYAAVTPGGITLDLTGPLQVPTGIAAGTISKAVTSTSSGQPLSDGWNLIGNPYQAPLNFVSLRSSNSSLVAAFAYYWVSNGTYTGNYGSYNALTGVSANGGTQFVAPHQGFMVRANGNGNVSFNNGMTGNTTAYAFLKSEGPSPEMPILRLSIKENGLISDEVVVASVAEAKENVSNDPYDTDKFFNNEVTKPELYLTESENGSNKLAVSTLPGLTNETVVPIGVSHVGVFNMVVTEMANIPTGVKVYLEDRKLDQQVKLHLGDAVTLTKGDGEAAEGRYFLRFGNEDNAITAEEAQMIGYSYVDNGSIQIKLMDAGINPSEAKVMDISGKLIGNFQLNNNNGVNSITSVVLAPGVYLIDVKTDKGTFVNKVVVPVN